MLIDILGLTFKPFPSYPIKMITDLHCFTSPGLTSHAQSLRDVRSCHSNFIQFLNELGKTESTTHLTMQCYSTHDRSGAYS